MTWVLDHQPKKPNRRRKPRYVVPWQRFQRYPAEIHSGGGDSAGRILLHDVGPEGVGLFVERKFLADEAIEIDLQLPHPLHLKGTVRWCAETPTESRVLHIKPFRYRIGVKLEFANVQERTAIEVFCVEFAIKASKQS